jgi:hypothetical protein
MTRDVWLEETYFDWLRKDAFSIVSERREYEGVLRTLHDIPFYWTIWQDENRAGDALSYRQYDFLGTQTGLETLDQKYLNAWAHSAPSVLEVMLGCARRWNSYFEGPIPLYFGHMFTNLTLDQYPGRVLNPRKADEVRLIVDNWMSHQFKKDGVGSPFPLRVKGHAADMTLLDIWSQMNAYSAEHFQ